jgi:hypothetical protein
MHQYTATINSLTSEIADLEEGQRRLHLKLSTQGQGSSHITTNKQQSGAGASSSDDIRWKKELREKSKLLEEKLKQLRSKESECSKVCSQKETLVKELDVMRRTIGEHKLKRVELQKKMREEQSQHMRERMNLKQAEVQSKRREQIAHQSVSRLAGTLQNKEKVWRVQLEAKDRESKQLRELIDKQQSVKQVRATAAVPSDNTVASSSLSAGSLSLKAAMDLKLWVEKELDDQVLRSTTQEQLSKETMLRSLLAKELQNACGESSSHNVKKLEDELRSKTLAISTLNAALADLGNRTHADKKRFSKVVELKEAKVLSEVLFDVAFRCQKKQRDNEDKVRRLQEQLIRHKKQLQNSQAAVAFYQQAAQRRLSDPPEDDDDMADEVAELDETFYPSDADFCEEEDDSDSSGSDRASKNKRKRPSKKIHEGGVAGRGLNKKRGGYPTASASQFDRSNDGVSDADSDSDSNEECPAKKPRGGNSRTKIASGMRAVVTTATADNSSIALPLSQYTVKELKGFLAGRGLAVSGVKDELVKRLGSFLQLQLLRTTEGGGDAVVADNKENICPATHASCSAPEPSSSKIKYDKESLLTSLQSIVSESSYCL